MNRKLWISFFIVLSLLVAGAQMQHPGFAAPARPVSQAGQQTFYASWTISVEYYRDKSGYGYVAWERRRINISGSATLHVPLDFGPSQALPFQLWESDDYERWQSGPCGTYHRTSSLTDSGRYMGGPDPFWVDPYIWLLATQDEQGWHMVNPLYTTTWEWGPGGIRRAYPYLVREEYKDTCLPENSYKHEWTWESRPPQPPPPPVPNGSAVFIMLPSTDGVNFFLDIAYDADPWTHVDYHVRVVRPCGMAAAGSSAAGQTPSANVCGCAAVPEGQTIDADDPIVTTLEVKEDLDLLVPLLPFDIPPGGRWPLHYTVTCMGRPVSNAELEISVRPGKHSGGHQHDDASWPRGYLDGTKITPANPSIMIRSDANGRATVQFEPGRDKTNELYGISGDYRVTARSTGFAYAQTHNLVRVGVSNLSRLGPGPNYRIAPSKSHKGGSTLYGREATVNAVRQLANDFRALQDAHNEKLKTPWPIAKVIVGDISLQPGGLLDLQNSWGTPYRGHDYGWDVRLDYEIPSGFRDLAGKRGLAWLERTFQMVGSKYGEWHWTDAKRNLRVSGAMGAGIAASQKTGGPDLTTVAFLSDPEDHYLAGAGQTVTYTVGVENLAAEAPAHGVNLTVALPSGLSLVRTVPPPTQLVGGLPVWDLGTLAAEGMPQIFDVAGQIGAAVAPGTVLTVTATASASEVDAYPADNQDESFGLVVQPPGADLSINSEIEAYAMIPGQLVTFTVGAGNGGNVPAAASELTLTLPVSVTLVDALPAPSQVGPGHASWQLGDIAPDVSPQVTVTVFLDPALGAAVWPASDEGRSGVLTYTLQANTDTVDFDTANNSRTVAMPLEFAGPDLLLNLRAATASGNPLSAGQDITYTVFYGNYGNQSAPTMTLTIFLWSGMQLVSAEPAPSRTDTSPTFLGGVLVWDMGDAPVGDAGRIAVRVHVADIEPAGSVVLAVANSDEVDLQPTDNVAVRIEGGRSYGMSYMLYLPLVMARGGL